MLAQTERDKEVLDKRRVMTEKSAYERE